MAQLPERLAGLKLDRLRTFLTVVRRGSFSAAAQELYLPQPRVSGHIADLERALGATLFDRSRQPVALTDSGQRLLPYAQSVVESLRSAAQDVAGADDEEVAGSVVVGMYPSAAAQLYGPLLASLAESHPRVELHLWEGSTLELESALDEGDVDLAVRPALPAPQAAGRMTSVRLWVEPLVVAVPEDSPLAGRTVLRLVDLEGLALITIGPAQGELGGPGGFESSQALLAAGLQGQVAHWTNQPQTLVSLVRSGLGVGVTNLLAMQTANLDGVTVIPLSDEGCTRAVALWHRSDAVETAAVGVVSAACRRLAAGLAGHPVTPH